MPLNQITNPNRTKRNQHFAYYATATPLNHDDENIFINGIEGKTKGWWYNDNQINKQKINQKYNVFQIYSKKKRRNGQMSDSKVEYC